MQTLMEIPSKDKSLEKRKKNNKIIIQIVVKEWYSGFKTKSKKEYTKDLISYLDNTMRHIADDWDIDECLHENSSIVDEDTLT